MKTLLFDKSAFEALGEHVHPHVREAYNVVTAATLLYELGRELAEDHAARANTTVERYAASLARRVGEVEVHDRWENLCLENLLGGAIELRVPRIQNDVIGHVPGLGMMALRVLRDDGTAAPATRNWVDRVATETWNTKYSADHRNFDVQLGRLWGSLRAKLQPPSVRKGQPAAEQSVVEGVDRVLGDPKLQLLLLMWLVDGLRIRTIPARTLRKRARRRWNFLGRPLLQDFAPYAFYCARVRLLYLFGFDVWDSRKGRELNDLADLDYLQLLPFVEVFATNDRFVRSMATHLLAAGQRLVDPSQLRAEFPNAVRQSGVGTTTATEG